MSDGLQINSNVFFKLLLDIITLPRHLYLAMSKNQEKMMISLKLTNEIEIKTWKNVS